MTFLLTAPSVTGTWFGPPRKTVSAMSTSGSATLVVQRPSGRWRDLLRSYVVVVDGVRVGTIRSGGELVVSLLPGHHRIEARIDWTGSEPVELVLHPGESAVLGVQPAGGAVRSLDQIVGHDRYLSLQRIG